MQLQTNFKGALHGCRETCQFPSFKTMNKIRGILERAYFPKAEKCPLNVSSFSTSFLASRYYFRVPMHFRKPVSRLFSDGYLPPRHSSIHSSAVPQLCQGNISALKYATLSSMQPCRNSLSPIPGRLGIYSSHLQRCMDFPMAMMFVQVRTKMVKVQAYHRRPRSYPFKQTLKPHLGPKRLSAEYVRKGQLLVKQRKALSLNINSSRRRHKKYYPGENVRVNTRNTSLYSTCDGRVKYTFIDKFLFPSDISMSGNLHEGSWYGPSSQMMIVNILKETEDELTRDNLWRYRTECVKSMEENRNVCYLRSKPPTRGSLPISDVTDKESHLKYRRRVGVRPRFLSRWDEWDNPTMPESKPLT